MFSFFNFEQINWFFSFRFLFLLLWLLVFSSSSVTSWLLPYFCFSPPPALWFLIGPASFFYCEISRCILLEHWHRRHQSINYCKQTVTVKEDLSPQWHTHTHTTQHTTHTCKPPRKKEEEETRKETQAQSQKFVRLCLVAFFLWSFLSSVRVP